MLNATVMEPIADSTSPDAAAAVDSALARSAAGGDMQAFEALYRRHAGRVHGVIQRLVGFHGVRAEAFGTWLHRLAVNTALMELRSRCNGPRFDEDEDAIEGLGLADSAGHSTALSMDLERAVATLPPRARAVLVLCDVEGWKHEEIAAELGMAVGSSKAQLHRARHLLRERLGAHA